MAATIRKAVFPAAGLGTRFLPATKAQPKEMLVLVDKPVIQYGVEEAVQSGISNIIIVTGRGKNAIEDHFDVNIELESFLEQRGKIAVNALWPRTTIATAAVRNLLGGDALMNMSRTPEILADAAWRIFQKPKTFTGNFIIDDTFLASEGVTDFDQYRVNPSQPLQVDFFVPDNIPPPAGVSLKALK